ncbi:MAG: hypothetical protein LBL08_03315 [Candidatus Nomurabacteria bacterium]|jgi:hypothetical protein|nr:hypothetical protein [Candidatus Nomurabacteria bacterium]
MYLREDERYRNPTRDAKKCVDFFGNDYKRGLAIFFVTVALIATWIIFAGYHGDQKSDIASAEQEINSLPKSERQALAKDVVEWYDAVEKLDEKMATYAMIDNEILSVGKLQLKIDDRITDNIQQWRTIAKNGDKIFYDYSFRPYIEHTSMWLIFFIGLAIIILGAGFVYHCICNLIMYAINCKQDRRFLIDVPRNRYCVALIITTLPLGWPFYIASAIRLSRMKKLRAQEKAKEESVTLLVDVTYDE